jgi:glutaredoxin
MMRKHKGKRVVAKGVWGEKMARRRWEKRQVPQIFDRDGFTGVYYTMGSVCRLYGK